MTFGFPVVWTRDEGRHAWRGRGGGKTSDGTPVPPRLPGTRQTECLIFLRPTSVRKHCCVGPVVRSTQREGVGGGICPRIAARKPLWGRYCKRTQKEVSGNALDNRKSVSRGLET